MDGGGRGFNSDPTQPDGCGASWLNSDQVDSKEIIDWKRFHNFLLQSMNERTAQDRLRYPNQYGKALQTGNASDLLQLQPDKRIHTMKALSNLAKFTGKYDVWLQLRQRYNLKWSTRTEKLDAFERFFDDNKILDMMLNWLRQAIQELSKFYSDLRCMISMCGRLCNMPCND